MISIFTMERPAMSPTVAPVGAALAAFPPAEMAANGFGMGAYAVDGSKPNACHDWITRDRQVDITTLRSSRRLRSSRT